MLDKRRTGLVKAQRGQDLNLLAGQLYFGGEASVVRTLLGSCVGITLWNPKRRLGGMCHFLLPQRAPDPNGGLDGRFGEEAVQMLVEAAGPDVLRRRLQHKGPDGLLAAEALELVAPRQAPPRKHP